MKKSKKFVLAGLALLAITGLLALSGCKNDTVPEPTRYTVKFETDHGTAPDDITVVSGTKLTDKDLAIEPEVGDNIFEYWYDKDVDAQKPVEEGYTVTKDVTLVAKWRDRGTVASVTFSPAGDTKFYCDESIAVSLTSEEGATIQYHLGDGSWKDYDAGRKIQVTGDTTITTITARAAKDGLKPSAVISATYTVRKLEGITVTSPTRTVYSERQSFDSTGMVVTATYDDGEERTVTGTITTDTSTLTESAEIGKTVTVSYMEGDTTKEATFTVDVVNVEEPTKLTTYTSPNNTDDSWTYMAFGEWPQTIKDASVSVDESEGKEMGMFTYYLGSDGNYYVKAEEKAKGTGTEYQYSNGEQAGQGGTSTKWFKVEPIVWRVLNKDYASTGKALLLAESILTGGVCYYVSINTRKFTKEKETEKVTEYTNNWQYSTVRAWLNGRYESDDPQANEYAGKGFLQTAFTESAQDLIADTSVDNSAASTIPSGINTEALKSDWNDGVNPYASDTPTTDKIFLLSEKEATNSEYGFDEYDRWVGDDYGTTTSTRIRDTTDYAKATGADQSFREGYGGWWWLRSPHYDRGIDAHVIRSDGDANYSNVVAITRGGVVPALCIPAKQLLP